LSFVITCINKKHALEDKTMELEKSNVQYFCGNDIRVEHYMKQLLTSSQYNLF